MSARSVREVLRSELVERLLRLSEIGEAHALEDPRLLRELDLRVLNDFDDVAPWIPEVEAPTGEHLHAGLRESLSRGLFRVDHEPEVPVLIRVLRPARRKRNELVAQVDKRHPGPAPAELELEDPPVERKRLLDVADLERHVV